MRDQAIQETLDAGQGRSRPAGTASGVDSVHGPADLAALYDDPAVVRAMEVLSRHAITGDQYEQLIARVNEVLGATLMVNRDPLGHVEVVREKTRENGVHLYRYKLYENGSVVTYGVIEHDESDGAYALMHKALGRILADHLVDD